MITTDEIHAVIIGAAETFCPWKAHYHERLPSPYHLKEEYHYYMAGRAGGFVLLCLLLTGLAKLVKELLL